MGVDINNEVNLEELSLEEIRKLAEEESRQQSEEIGKTKIEQPRNDDGTFAPKEKTEGAEESNDDGPEEFVFERTVDLGDGSGKQVFRGKGTTEVEALQNLADKLATAQEHATKKIRELAKKVPAPQAEERKFTAEDEFIYSQELLAKPTEAFKKLFKDVTGVDISQFKTVHQRNQAIIEAQQQTENRQKVGDQFVALHPEYDDTNDTNAKRMAEALQLSGDYSLDSFEKAYQFLKSSGLLVLKGEEAHAGAEAEKQVEERIAQKPATEVTPQRTKKASGISTKGRPAAQVLNTLPSEDDLYDSSKYSLEDVKRLANQQLAQKR